MTLVFNDFHLSSFQKLRQDFETETNWKDFDKYISTRLFNAADQTVKDTPEKCDSDGFSADEFYVVLDKPYRYYEGANLLKINSPAYSAILNKCVGHSILKVSCFSKSAKASSLCNYLTATVSAAYQ